MNADAAFPCGRGKCRSWPPRRERKPSCLREIDPTAILETDPGHQNRTLPSGCRRDHEAGAAQGCGGDRLSPRSSLSPTAPHRLPRACCWIQADSECRFNQLYGLDPKPGCAAPTCRPQAACDRHGASCAAAAYRGRAPSCAVLDSEGNRCRRGEVRRDRDQGGLVMKGLLEPGPQAHRRGHPRRLLLHWRCRLFSTRTAFSTSMTG